MKGSSHKILGLLIFIFFFYFKLFPAVINEYLNSLVPVIIGFIIAFLFSGGRTDSKKMLGFGLSPDNDYHKKMKRDWLIHSAILPTLVVILLPNPILLLASFFYTTHIAFDLLNTHSWDGNKTTYIGVFITVILFYLVIYS
ncbi:MAG: hypothetical protein JW791_01640 [Nanoarchaeota archaeon]|nr:hypothetical protein [Nanoarchaeota archaeon]